MTGRWQVVRSTDSGLGGHLADPSHTHGARTADGRWAWSAALEAALLGPATSLPIDPERGLRPDLLVMPDWAARPVARVHTATNYSTLVQLRADTGDPTLRPFARYLRADTGTPHGPVAAGPHPDASTWGDLDWRLDGHPVSLTVRQPGGTWTTLGDPKPGIRIVVRSIADYLTGWANPHDPSTTGPRRGLRHPKPVTTAPGMTRVVGRDGTELDRADTDPAHPRNRGTQLVYGTAAGAEELRARARAAGTRPLAARAGVPVSTVNRYLAGGTTSPDVLAKILHALDADTAPSVCALPGCTEPARPRSPWCSERHKKAGARAKPSPVPKDPGPVLAGCPTCRARFINPKAAELHQCKGPRP